MSKAAEFKLARECIAHFKEVDAAWDKKLRLLGELLLHDAATPEQIWQVRATARKTKVVHEQLKRNAEKLAAHWRIAL